MLINDLMKATYVLTLFGENITFWIIVKKYLTMIKITLLDYIKYYVLLLFYYNMLYVLLYIPYVFIHFSQNT